MTIFHTYVKLPEGTSHPYPIKSPENPIKQIPLHTMLAGFFRFPLRLQPSSERLSELTSSGGDACFAGLSDCGAGGAKKNIQNVGIDMWV